MRSALIKLAAQLPAPRAIVFLGSAELGGEVGLTNSSKRIKNVVSLIFSHFAKFQTAFICGHAVPAAATFAAIVLLDPDITPPKKS